MVLRVSPSWKRTNMGHNLKGHDKVRKVGIVRQRVTYVYHALDDEGASTVFPKLSLLVSFFLSFFNF